MKRRKPKSISIHPEDIEFLYQRVAFVAEISAAIFNDKEIEVLGVPLEELYYALDSLMRECRIDLKNSMHRYLIERSKNISIELN